jgi:hypothetical protein
VSACTLHNACHQQSAVDIFNTVHCIVMSCCNSWLSCLLQDVYGQFHGWVQVNDQPLLLGQVALACDTITKAYDNTLSPHKALQAVADVSYYFRSNGSSNWCYSFNSNYSMIVGDPDATLRAYSYQVIRCLSTKSSALHQKSRYLAASSPSHLTFLACLISLTSNLPCMPHLPHI